MNLNEEGLENEKQIEEPKEMETLSTPKDEAPGEIEEKHIEEPTAELHDEDEGEDLETDEYSGLEKAQLIKKLKELISIEDTDHTHHTVRKIKDAYLHIPKENAEIASEDEVVKQAIDPEDEAFHTLLKTYKQKRDKQKKEKDTFIFHF